MLDTDSRRVVGWSIGSTQTATPATNALGMAISNRSPTSSTIIHDLSVLETQVLGLTYFPVSFFDALGRPFRTERRRSVSGVATASDGLVAVGCGTAQQWFDLCALVGHPELSGRHEGARNRLGRKAKTRESAVGPSVSGPDRALRRRIQSKVQPETGLPARRSSR